jgi:hypothetical protein
MEQPGQEQQEYASFLIRMWREVNLGAPGTPTEWRGEIEHIQSGRRTDFRTLAALSDWLNAQILADEIRNAHCDRSA